MAEDDWVIKVENVGKKFTRSLKKSMVYGLKDVTKSILGLPVHEDSLRDSEFWAVQNVSFELKRGESLGLIGRNGSGKSTLLRLINGIYPPSQGSITIKGRMGALIAVGAGFHPHMTGYENIFLNATILGMSRAEIEEKIDDIIAFAEIGEFIDAPVSTYSSGMTVRLGFAIAVHADIDILLADEVLAVGDVSFVQKCQNKIGELKAKGVSMILVSHSAEMLLINCTTGVYLKKGEVIQTGAIADVLQAYEVDLMNKNQLGNGERVEYAFNPAYSFRVTDVRFNVPRNANNQLEMKSGESLEISIDYESKEDVSSLDIHIGLRLPEGQPLGFFKASDFQQELSSGRGSGTFVAHIHKLNFMNVVLLMGIAVQDRSNDNQLYWRGNIPVYITGRLNSIGILEYDFNVVTRKRDEAKGSDI